MHRERAWDLGQAPGSRERRTWGRWTGYRSGPCSTTLSEDSRGGRSLRQEGAAAATEVLADVEGPDFILPPRANSPGEAEVHSDRPHAALPSGSSAASPVFGTGSRVLTAASPRSSLRWATAPRLTGAAVRQS